MRLTVAVLAASSAVMWFLGIEAALIAVVAAAAVSLIAMKPERSIYFAFVLAFTTLPAVVPEVIPAGQYTALVFEPFLMIAAAYALLAHRPTPRTGLRLTALVALLLGWSVFGFTSGHTIAEVIKDIRPLVYLIAAFVIATRIWGTPVAERCLWLLPRMLWVSAAFSLAGSALGLPLQGRTIQATLNESVVSADAATRLLTPASFLALCVVCGCLALAVARYRSLRQTAYLAAPALLIVILSFSRNNVLAIVVAGAFAVIAARSMPSLARATRVAAATVAAGFVLVLLGPALGGIPGGQYINTQVNGFSTRVLGGLTSQARATDPSVQFRYLSEDAIIKPQVHERPLTGYGFGYAYKAPIPGPEFFQVSAPYYAHNYYWWLLLKTGGLGLLVFVFAIASLAVRALGNRSPATIALGATLAGMLAVSFYAPLANGIPSSVLVGGVSGLLAAALSAQRSNGSDDTSSMWAPSRSAA